MEIPKGGKNELYNAVGGRNYTDPEKLDVVTLEGAVYEVEEENPELELRVQVLNINDGFNEELKEACLILREYMQYVDKVRIYAGNMPILDILKEKGIVPEGVERKIRSETDEVILREWLKLAGRVQDIDEFIEEQLSFCADSKNDYSK